MLCRFADDFPKFVADFLDRSSGMRRRFREESITDMMMASLAVLDPRHLIVDFPKDESVTGADMEWSFVNLDDGTFFRLLVQAKSVYGGIIWSRLGYRHLFHQVRKTSAYQAVLLAQAARGQPHTYPLYALYHPASCCKLGARNGASHLKGVNLADGFVVEQRVLRGISTGKFARERQLKRIAPLLFDLEQLFCPDTLFPLEIRARLPDGVIYFAGGVDEVGVHLPPTPAIVRDRLAARRDLGFPPGDIPAMPELGREIPRDVMDLIERRHRDRDAGAGPMPRYRVVFLSRTVDHAGGAGPSREGEVRGGVRRPADRGD